MAGRVLEPFPRGLLVGTLMSTTTYYSEPYDVGEAKSLAYWAATLGSFPASVTDPMTAYIETSNTLHFGDWVNMTPSGITPANFSTPETGSVEDPMRYIRVRMVLTADESPMVEFRMVARDQ